MRAARTIQPVAWVAALCALIALVGERQRTLRLLEDLPGVLRRRLALGMEMALGRGGRLGHGGALLENHATADREGGAGDGDRLNELSLKIEGSAISSFPFVGFNVVIINWLELNVQKITK